ncbi:cryptochrome/photolyase family protein [Sneathiella sp.]|jgi:deoxyribodipyrimidine photolyase-related protein|uniref:cryptochrome/photolyase family protein n=1 Tax=Sneathiella sp. TaxID=1964365 RepID=UPI0039E53348
MKTLRLILGDQLNKTITSLKGCDPKTDILCLYEVQEEATFVKHHKKKIAFLFSAMRHFAEELRQAGHTVLYSKLDDPRNTGSFRGEVERTLAAHDINKIVVAHPGEYRMLKEIESWQSAFDIPVEIKPDNRFLASAEEFNNWADGRKQLRMEYFYREMRKRYSILMDGDEPVGGQWNFDPENRNPPQTDLTIPTPFENTPDALTQDVLEMVADCFSDHFGDLQPFHFAVTRRQAKKALRLFIDERLALFGDYQDAMVEQEPWMYHAHISFYLNCGLLLPLECVEAAEKAYHEGTAPLNAVEGFIRQIVGWREYVRGVYWLKMPGYSDLNFFNATRNLPDFFWTADTDMNCLRHSVTETKVNAYAHHIQRLMVLGNFALLAGVDPDQVNEWFLIVYADAYEWVELPNVTGMALFADGGQLASKPYASSGSYINKMSNYCKNCRYRVTKKNGPDACPFNYLYWDFLTRNRNALKDNPRVGMMYKTYDRMKDDKKQAIRDDSQRFLEKLS